MADEGTPTLLREIAYDLAYVGDSPKVEQAVVRALSRLPRDVRGWALEDCLFASVGDNTAGLFHSLKPPVEGVEPFRWVVVIAENLSVEDTEATVAHELAHISLGHEIGALVGSTIEEEACALAREWGFTGLGATEYPGRDLPSA